ncbi:type II secretion system protein M [Vibrio gallicus]|uniref:type II secretion system protein M n=1 Tax=Vibrio gallicus TaxID=190897 RepID=UPI0021C3CFAC|nr:type II secretion system protein M [Vibrio gallicus]
MKKQWLELCERFSDLSLREKWLIAAGGWVVIVLVCMSFILEPATDARIKAERSLAQQKQSIQIAQADIKILIAKLKRNPDKEIDQKLKQLILDNQALSEQLSQVVNSLISSSQMAGLLEQVLSSGGKLKLVSLQSLPAESITKLSDETGYFLHPVRITLDGRYFDIQHYLKALEDMPVKYYWRSFDYRVQKYPTAQLVLEVYTIGTRQEFISG